MPTRRLPLAASLFILVDIAASGAPDAARNAVTALYLMATYGLLGVLIVRDAGRMADASHAGTAS